MFSPSLLRSSFLLASSTLLASPAFAAVTPLAIHDRPLHFEANQGQARGDVKFLSRGPGYGVYLTANEAVLVLSAPASRAEEASGGNATAHCTADDAAPQKPRVLRMGLRGSAKTPSVRGLEGQSGKANYLIGNDASSWRTNIPTYAKVRYNEVYPGIDLVYYGHQRQLEYDFVVAPGADPKKIVLSFDGADRVEIDASGDLVLHACGREIRQRKPVIYQDANGRREVAGGYVRKGKNQIGFAVAAFDRSLPLIIDPIVLSYATYLGGSRVAGGSGEDGGSDIAIDAHGSAYVTGTTGSMDFPVTPGAYRTSAPGWGGPDQTGGDVFVTKFNADGSVAYSTYVGGLGNDYASAIAVDANGSAYVAGDTDDARFLPTTPGAFQTASSFSQTAGSTAFVTKLDPTGSALVYSTLLGVPNTYGSPETYDIASDIAVDLSGNAYVTGYFTGQSVPDAFPTAPKGYTEWNGRVFVVKLNPTGAALEYASRFGSTAIYAYPLAIALDGDGNAYVAGTANSGWPVTTGAFQTSMGAAPAPVVTKLGSAGQLVYSTYLGATQVGRGIAVSTDGSAYVPVATLVDHPVGPGPGFLRKLNPSGSAVVYSTPLAKPARDIAIDAQGRAYVGAGDDEFVTIVEPSGSAVSVSGIYGGNRRATVAGIGLDPAGKNVWVVGSTNADDFPATADAYQPHRGPGTDSYSGTPAPDAFLMKFATDTRPVPGSFEAENFDRGGEGVAYHDNTAGNQGDAQLRTGEDVDIFVSNDAAGASPHIVKNFEAGEWLIYTISVTASGNYDIDLRASTHPAFPNTAFHIEVDGTNVTGTVLLPDTGAWDHYQWLGKRTVALAAGTHALKLVSERAYFNLNSIRVISTLASNPYSGSPAAVPGELEAEAFDTGGERIAYHDNRPGNQGNAGFRAGEDVDIFVSNDASSASPYVVKNLEAGEWLAYSVNVSAGGNYEIELRAATDVAFPNSAYHIEADGLDVTGTVVLPNTGGWDQYQWVGKRTIALAAGAHVLKLVSERPFFSLNSIRINAATPSTSYSGTPAAVPGVLEAETFDIGGESVAYHDTAPGNQGDSGFRTGEDVDIFVSNDASGASPYIVKNFAAGEWLAYTVSASAGGNYDIDVRASTHSGFPNRAYHLEVDGRNVTGTVALPDTGGWDNYQWLGKRTVALTAGTHVLKVVSEQAYFNLNSLRVVQSP